MTKTSSDPLEWPAAAGSSELQSRIEKAKVLCVGAGGIGCELLKTLALSGFRDIQVIDLDTIETSNLNRQFLFRKRHVGQSKASVAAEAVRRFAPNAAIQPHQGNVKDAAYDIDFFKSFDLVLNGLDNMEARRHVNRLTLAAGTPLVESGTEGYLGQVTVHLKGHTECFECQPKSAPKSYPVCTIRNTPDKPIHCVVWAKDLLFPRLFGRPEAVTDLDETDAAPAVATAVDAAEAPLPDPDAAAAAAQAGSGPATDAQSPEAQADSAAQSAKQAAEDASFFLRKDGEGSGAYARRIFRRVFTSDIERVLRMKDLWKTRKPPTPLHLDELVPPAAARVQEPHANGVAAIVAEASASAALGLTDQHRQLTVQELTALFLEATQRFLDFRSAEVGSAVFDKEDDLAVDFVMAAANLRAAAYNIPTQTWFDAKGMAGNIVHAVATTNAVISGLITLEAMKLLAGAPAACRNTFLQQHASSHKLVQPTTTWPPTKSCVVCGTAQLQLSINTATTPLDALIDKVLKKRLALVNPTVVADSFMYEEGPDLDADEAAEYAAHRPTPLQQLPGGGIRNGSIVAISDQAQAFEAQLVVRHREEWDEEKEPEGFLLEGAVPAAAAAADASAQPAAAADAAAASDSDDFEMLDGPPDSAALTSAAPDTAAGTKRKRPADADAEGEAGPSSGTKRPALADGLGAVLADPDDDDAILLE